jgi:hypothetical protein
MIGNRAVGRLVGGGRTMNPIGAEQRFNERVEENGTGIPDHLRAGIETLSGVSLDDVKVHYNDARPARFDALAFTRGAEIYLGPGQGRHLPHEVWHVVQQKQGRVRPTRRVDGATLNTEAVLEKEADVMGRKVASVALRSGEQRVVHSRACPSPLIQRVIKDDIVKEGFTV